MVKKSFNFVRFGPFDKTGTKDKSDDSFENPSPN